MTRSENSRRVASRRTRDVTWVRVTYGTADDESDEMNWDERRRWHSRISTGCQLPLPLPLPLRHSTTRLYCRRVEKIVRTVRYIMYRCIAGKCRLIVVVDAYMSYIDIERLQRVSDSWQYLPVPGVFDLTHACTHSRSPGVLSLSYLSPRRVESPT